MKGEVYRVDSQILPPRSRHYPGQFSEHCQRLLIPFPFWKKLLNQHQQLLAVSRRVDPEGQRTYVGDEHVCRHEPGKASEASRHHFPNRKGEPSMVTS